MIEVCAFDLFHIDFFLFATLEVDFLVEHGDPENSHHYGKEEKDENKKAICC